MVFFKQYPGKLGFDTESILKEKSPTQLVNETIGPLFLACVISTALFGLTCAQSCLYFKRHAQDHAELKFIIFAILLLETSHLALVIHSKFFFTVANHGSFNRLHNTVWSMLIQVIPATLIVVLVQYVWIIRIRTLSQSRRKAQVAFVMLFLVVIDAGISIAWMAVAFASPRWGSSKIVQWAVVACFSLRAINDTSVTGLFYYHLQRSKNGKQGTDGMIQTMVAYGLRTGLINCMGSVVLMVVIVTMPTKPYYAAINMISCRVYANSLLAMLNWRMPQKTAKQNTSDPEAIELSTVDWGFSTTSRVTRFTITELENM